MNYSPPRNPALKPSPTILKWHRTAVISAVCALLLLGCASEIKPLGRFLESERAAARTITPPPEEGDKISSSKLDPQAEVEHITPQNAGSNNPRGHSIEPGTGRFINPPGRVQSRAVESENGDVILNFQGVDLAEVIDVVLGSILKVNYVIDPDVTGSVTIETARPLAKSEVLAVLESLVRANGAALTVDSNGVHRISTSDSAVRRATLSNRNADGYRVEIIPLRFISVTEMQKLIEPFVPQQGILLADEKRNILMVAGSREEIARVIETVDVFDIAWFKGLSVAMYYPNFVEPKVLIAEINQAIGSGDQLLDGLVKLQPISRLGAVMAVAKNPALLEEVSRWIKRLDRSGTQIGRRLFVYQVQNTKAADLAQVLNDIFSSNGNKKNKSPQLAPGISPGEVASNSPQSNQAADLATEQQLPQTERSGIALPEENEIRIIADEINNSLVIMATNAEYQTVESAIKKLDILPLQVLIEATIIEVSLTNNLQYGVEWFFKNSAPSGFGGEGLLDLSAPGFLPPLPSFSYTITKAANDVRLVLDALSEESEVQVLSSPSLMVLDNQTATINVGDEIPIPTRQSTSNFDSTAPTVNEIEYRNTGVILTVTPRINDGGLVTMEVRQEVSDAVQTTSSTLNAPTIQQRNIESSVAVQSGETVILGGLIRDTDADNDSGVPFLHEIPWVGNLFGRTDRLQRRTELLVLITPRAIRSIREARGVTQEYRERLRSFKPDVETISY